MGKEAVQPGTSGPQFLADRDHRDFEILPFLSSSSPSMSLKYTTFSLRESCISFLVPAWHFHMCSSASLPSQKPWCLRLFTVFTCFLVALRWLLGWCQESSPHSLQLFLLRPLSKYLFSMYARGTPSFNPFSKFIISNLIYHHYLFSNYLFTYKVFGVWAFSQSKLGASVAGQHAGSVVVAHVGLDSPRHMGSRAWQDRPGPGGPNHIFCIGRQTLNTGPPRKSSYHHSLPADFPGLPHCISTLPLKYPLRTQLFRW